MLEITTELLEHYLRATGTQYDRVKLAALVAKDGIEEASFMYLDIVGIFRLGLCAAANNLISSAHATEKINTPPDDILFALVGEDRMQAHELLRLAGVDSSAWESARKR